MFVCTGNWYSCICGNHSQRPSCPLAKCHERSAPITLLLSQHYLINEPHFNCVKAQTLHLWNSLQVKISKKKVIFSHYIYCQNALKYKMFRYWYHCWAFVPHVSSCQLLWTAPTDLCQSEIPGQSEVSSCLMCISKQGEPGLVNDPQPGKCRSGCHLLHSENCFRSRALGPGPVHERCQISFLDCALFLSHELWGHCCHHPW